MIWRVFDTRLYDHSLLVCGVSYPAVRRPLFTKLAQSFLLSVTTLLYLCSSVPAQRSQKPTAGAPSAGQQVGAAMYQFGAAQGAADAISGAVYTSNDLRQPMLRGTLGPQERKYTALVIRAKQDKQWPHYLALFGQGYLGAMKKSGRPPVVPTAKPIGPNLTALGLVVINYTLDHGGRLPMMRTGAEMKASLQKYPGVGLIFSDRAAEPIPNPSVSGKAFSKIAKPSAVILAYNKTGASGMRTVLFIDGRVRQLNESEWAVSKKLSNVP